MHASDGTHHAFEKTTETASDGVTIWREVPAEIPVADPNAWAASWKPA